MVEVGCEVRDLMGWGKRNLERKGWVGRWVLVNVSFMWFHFLRWLMLSINMWKSNSCMEKLCDLPIYCVDV